MGKSSPSFILTLNHSKTMVSPAQEQNLESLCRPVPILSQPENVIELPVAKRLLDFRIPQPGAREELLFHRFLCRKSGLLFVGTTGAGKSSAAMQLAICWSLGRPGLGIAPNGKLKSLIIQSENDDGDMAEMCNGVFNGLGLSPEDKGLASEAVVVARVKRKRGVELLPDLRILAENHQPDLIWIDPVLAYLYGDVNSANDAGGFTRDIIDPLAEEFDCGVILLHHTPKPSKEKTSTSGDWLAYTGAGSAEWSNWARGVLFLEKKSRETFLLHGAKRGDRIRWKTADDKLLFTKPIRYSREIGVICWEEDPLPMESDPALAAAVKWEGIKNFVLERIADAGSIGKKTLLNEIHQLGVSINRSRDLVDELVENKFLSVRKEVRTPYLELQWDKVLIARPDLAPKKPLKPCGT